ncbi:MAG: (Fe-S)-binding protein [Candidatus Bathyarchaeia archaeon]
MVLENFAKQIYRCARVSWCKHPVFNDRGINKICPLHEYPKHSWESYSIRGILSAAQALLEGRIAIDEKFAEIIYKCNLCGGCHEVCVIHFPVFMKVSEIDELDHVSIVEELRRICIEEGFLRIPAHRNALESLLRYGNPFSIARKEERLKWTEELGFQVKRLPRQKADVLLYTGSMYALEPLVRDTTKSIARVLNKANVDFGLLEDELDDGLYAAQLGESGLFEELAERNIKIFNEIGVKEIVTPDPHAYNAFKRYYPRVGNIEAEIFHITEYVDMLVKNGKLNLGKLPEETVTYHDPCNLGRLCGVYDAPRNIVKAIEGLDFREMERNKNYAWCCGAGGGVMMAYPEYMTWTTRERIKDVTSVEASTLITACPWCEYAFKTALESAGSTIQVRNIVELVEKSAKLG